MADAPTFPDIWDQMLRHMGELPLVAHNASFDMGVLERLFSIWQVEPVARRYACTVKLSRALCAGAPSPCCTGPAPPAKAAQGRVSWPSTAPGSTAAGTQSQRSFP